MKRVLFVDDEPNILDGLRRMLRAHRSTWDMAFVSSGAAALAAMEGAPFDVLVTDMRMPGMSGVQLLEEVHRRHPRTVRIILSGQAEAEACLRSVAVSHQFLAKPCDARTLEEVVERACRLEELLQDPHLRAVLGGITGLPVLPRVYRSLCAALAEPEPDVRRIGEIVAEDTAIASKVLQLVNSSYFGLRRSITDLRQATTYLGLGTIRDLVLTLEVFRQLEPEHGLAGFSLEREQRHALLSAAIARRVAPDRKLAETAALAAMLHDVGKLVLATHLPQSFRQVLAAGGGERKPFHRAEQELSRADHAHVGAYLLGLWGMPYPVVEAVAHHHRPAAVEGRAELDVIGIVHLADGLARELEGSDPAAIELDLEYLERVGARARLTEWRAQVAEVASGGARAA